LAVYVTVLVMCVARVAGAKPPLPAAQWTPSAKLALAQAIVGEATWRRADRAPISWVLAKRWRQAHRTHKWMTFERMVRQYASPMKAKQHWVRSLPWGPITARYRSQWAGVRDFVERWGIGGIPDPCPQAIHWGGDMDTPYRGMKREMVPVNCGNAANTFYALVAR